MTQTVSIVRVRLYNRAFWCTYLSNTLLMVAVSMLFRYADLVMVLGGNEFHLGWIVGFGSIGSVLMRIVQGSAIDRFGAGRIWLLCMLSLIVSLIAHTWVGSIGPSLFLWRLAYAASLSACFASSITFVSVRAPVARTAEMIGSLGSSGFVGMALGPAIADYLLSSSTITRADVSSMFFYAASVAVLSLVAATVAVMSSKELRRSHRKSPPSWWLVRRYHPGRILLIGFSMGLGISIPFSFVRTYAESIQVDQIRGYFFLYAVSAFAVRIKTRTLPDTWGVRPTIILGITLLCCSLLSFLFAINETMLLVSGFVGGLAHAFVFPSAVTGCSLSFPTRYRGLATTVMLAMFDLGALVGQPAVGTLWYVAKYFELPAYPSVFAVVALFMAGTGIYYVSDPRQHEKSGVTIKPKRGRSKDGNYARALSIRE